MTPTICLGLLTLVPPAKNHPCPCHPSFQEFTFQWKRSSVSTYTIGSTQFHGGTEHHESIMRGRNECPPLAPDIRFPGTRHTLWPRSLDWCWDPNSLAPVFPHLFPNKRPFPLVCFEAAVGLCQGGPLGPYKATGAGQNGHPLSKEDVDNELATIDCHTNCGS